MKGTQTMSLFSPVTNQQGGENVPEGLYLLTVNSVGMYERRDTDQPSQFGDDPRAQWKFGIVDVISATKPRPSADNPNPKAPREFVGSEIWDYSSLSMGPRSKAREWCEAILNRELREGETIDPDKLQGNLVRGTIGRSQTGRHKITSLLPYEPDDDAEAEPEREPVAVGRSGRRDGDPFD
jgi:hypothetical protein